MNQNRLDAIVETSLMRMMAIICFLIVVFKIMRM